ncbi:hypothetical protein HJFPF1_05254 [Paramyrothecium foliicola]|nr:hypothetical protein HJFPF1_05254 [Paramyrothecium foliicola]
MPSQSSGTYTSNPKLERVRDAKDRNLSCQLRIFFTQSPETERPGSMCPRAQETEIDNQAHTIDRRLSSRRPYQPSHFRKGLTFNGLISLPLKALNEVQVFVMGPGEQTYQSSSSRNSTWCKVRHIRDIAKMAVRTGEAGVLIGALTTAWSIPQSCTVNFVVCSTCIGLYQGQKCLAEPDPNNGDSQLQDNYECWPPRNTRVNRPPSHPLVGWGFYSPGLACPTGYVSACTAEYDRRPEWDIQFNLRPSETAIGCCPEGFTCTNRFGNTCMQVATDGMEVLTATCSGTNMAGSAMATLSSDTITITDSASSETVTERTYTMWAPMFQLNFQSTDVETTTSSGPRPGSTQKPPAGSTSEPTAASTTSEPLPSSDSQTSSGGLSTGAAAGIGAGVAVAAIAALLLIAFLIWRRRRRHRESRLHGSSGSSGPEKHASPGAANGGYVRQEDTASNWTHGNYEMQPGHRSAQRSELGEFEYQELAAFRQPHEPQKAGSPHSQMGSMPIPMKPELGGYVPVELPAERQ